MKYKNINSALHNFGQSFMSGMNYFEGDHVMYDVIQMARKAINHKFQINFSTGNLSQPALLNNRVKKSIEHYRRHLPTHLESHGLNAGSVKEVILKVRLTHIGQELTIMARDDRGTEYNIPVSQA